jgi:hypothetical protein
MSCGDRVCLLNFHQIWNDQATLVKARWSPGTIYAIYISMWLLICRPSDRCIYYLVGEFDIDRFSCLAWSNLVMVLQVFVMDTVTWTRHVHLCTQPSFKFGPWEPRKHTQVRRSAVFPLSRTRLPSQTWTCLLPLMGKWGEKEKKKSKEKGHSKHRAPHV